MRLIRAEKVRELEERAENAETLLDYVAERNREVRPTIERLRQLGGVEFPALVEKHVDVMRENAALRARVRQLEHWLDVIIAGVVEDEFSGHCEGD